jgi:catechol 2,3-dioxygenase-like lactoylglutathione lyase family enzyme
MALDALDHYTIQCADMAATRDFYRDVLGLSEGFRPQFGFAGHWLYCGGVPVVHLVGADGALKENGGTRPGAATGAFDHIAFRGQDAAATIARLKGHGIAFRENQVRDLGLHQVFVRDPDGVIVEMNFREQQSGGTT